MQTEMKTLLAYHADPALKTKLVARVNAHAKADEIIQGRYWEMGMGCLVGCAAETNRDPHMTLEREFGLDCRVTLLADRIFERCPRAFAKEMAPRFYAAIEPGADLSLVPHHLAIWLLTSPDSLFTQVVKEESDKQVLADVAALYSRFVAGDHPTDEEWSAVEARASKASERAWNDYLALDLDLALALALALDLALDLALALALARALDLDLALDLDQLTQKFFVPAAEKFLLVLSEAPVAVVH